MSRKSVYVLESVTTRTECYGSSLIGKYGEIEIYKETVGVFDSVNEAEKTISKMVKIAEKDSFVSESPVYFCFILDEHYMNDSLDKNGCVSLFESRRTYLSNGKLNCFSDLDYRCEKKFCGRDRRQKVKRGDIALYLSDKIYPVLIEETSLTKGEWKKRTKPGVYGDFSDDSGISFLCAYGHIHPFSPMVFPIDNFPGYSPSSTVVERLNKERDNYYEEITRYDEREASH